MEYCGGVHTLYFIRACACQAGRGALVHERNGSRGCCRLRSRAGEPEERVVNCRRGGQNRQAAGSGGRLAGDDSPPGETPPQSHALDPESAGSVLAPGEPPDQVFLRPVGLATVCEMRGVCARLPMFRLSGKGEK